MSSTKKIIVKDQANCGVRLDRALVDLLDMSRSQIQKALDENRVQKNSAPASKNDTLSIGDVIEIFIPDAVKIDLGEDERAVDILYEDEYLAIVNKPPGISVHPSDAEPTGTLVNILIRQIKDLCGINGEIRPGIVHRIDKFTSGALVICKTDKCHQAMSEIFSKHEIKRCYWAYCYGNPSWDKTRIDVFIGRNPKDRKKMTVLKTETADARRSVSHFQVIERYQDGNRIFACKIQAQLETGRTHQVRVHLTHMGFSIFGDAIYGTPTNHQPKFRDLPTAIKNMVQDLPGQALHARTLGFRHPILDKDIYVEAPEFLQFQQLGNALKPYAK
jgi:23S rRNA pseudouridine1911/1915/1917 synthase